MVLNNKDKIYSHKAFGHDVIALQMQAKMMLIIGCLLLAVYIFLTSVFCRILFGSEGISQLRTWGIAQVISPLLPGTDLSLHKNGRMITASAGEFAQSATLRKWVMSYRIKILLAAILPLPIWLFFPWILQKYKSKEQDRLKPKYLDGAKLLSPQKFKKQIEDKYKETYLPFGGWYDGSIYHPIQLPINVENAHIAVIGGTRSGKTVLLSQMLHALRQRGDITLVLDQKGDYLEKFYKSKKDYILNVLDDRCMAWKFWNDLEKENTLLRMAEIETVAGGLIPDSKESTEQFFRAGARDVLVGLLTWLDQQGRHTYGDLWQIINQPREQIAKILADINHRGHVFVNEPGKQSQGVISVLMQFGRVFEYASMMDDNHDQKNTYRIQDWLDHGQGFVYLTNYDAIRDTLRPMLSLFINFMAKKILTGRENLSSRRIWLFLDEFGALHKIDTLIDILTRGGSKGVCVVLASQDRGQVEEVYGRNMTDAIFNSCNSWAALRCTDPSTARLIVDRVGEQRYERQEESIGDRIDDGGDSINISKKIIREKLLLDAQVMGQEPLRAYIHIDGCDYSHIAVEKRYFGTRHPAFVPRVGQLPLPEGQLVRLDKLPESTFNHDQEMKIGV